MYLYNVINYMYMCRCDQTLWLGAIPMETLYVVFVNVIQDGKDSNLGWDMRIGTIMLNFKLPPMKSTKSLT